MDIAIIGSGMIAEFHALAIQSIPELNLKGFASRNTESSQVLAHKFGVYSYNSIEAMLKDKSISIVTIASPSGNHMEHCINAANAKKHIICEKPLEITLERIDKIIEACKKNRVILSGIFNRRFHPIIAKIKKAVDQERLGKLSLCSAYIKWYRDQVYYDSKPWRGTWELDGGGALMNQSIHTVDQLIYLAGDIHSVCAMTACVAHNNIEVEDTAVAILEFKNGARGVIEASTAAWSETGHPAEVHLCGSEGSIFLSDESIKVWDLNETIKGDKEFLSRYGKQAKVGLGAKDPSAINFTGHQKNFQDVVNAIKEKKKPLLTGKEARRSVQVICAIYESAQNNGKKIILNQN